MELKRRSVWYDGFHQLNPGWPVEKGRPFARGLEFGTTRLSHPDSVLIVKGAIFGRPIIAHLDAGQTETRSYVAFTIGYMKAMRDRVNAEHQTAWGHSKPIGVRVVMRWAGVQPQVPFASVAGQQYAIDGNRVSLSDSL